MSSRTSVLSKGEFVVGDADAVRIGGRYRLERQLAAGGMGTVWLAWDESLRRQVAVKRLHLRPGLSASERDDAVERAMREGRITARLQHPHAVPVYDVVDDDNGPCLVMQYVPSRSLATVVTEDGPLPPHEVARIGTQIAAALAAAHRVGIVHRDVKPANILIADDGTAKITDFGVSHALDDSSITSTGMVTGTPGFLAPEVARGEASTPASDVFSLGSTLYLAVEGVAPFGTDQNAMAVLHRVASGRPRPPERAGSLRPVLERLMAPAPADRPDMVTVATQLPDLHPLTADGEAPDKAVTQALRAIPTVPSAAPSPVANADDTQVFARRPADNRTAAIPSAVPPPVLQPRTPPPSPVPMPAGEPVARSDRKGESHRTVFALLAAVVVVLLGAGLLVVLLSNAGNGDDNVAGPGASTSAPAPSTRPSSSPPTSASSRSSSSQPPTSSSPKPSTSRPSSTRANRAAQRVTNADLASAVTGYFQLIPGDLDAAWDRLTPGFQQGRAGGRGTFDSYWDSVRRVDVRNAVGNAPGQASALLVYYYKDGRVVSQQTSFRFVRQNGQLKIDAQN